jgi:hypothetical protein
MSDTRERADETDAEEAAAREVERSLLRTENERLRRELARSTRTTYRRTALALLALGVLTALTAIVFPAIRDVLVIVGAIGVFGGILTWYLTPERVLAVSVIEGTFDAHASALASMQAELGLSDEHVYVPTGDHVGRARLFVPLHASYDIPDSMDDLFLTTDTETERGISVQPTGAKLARALEQSISGDLSRNRLSDVVPEALVEQFELADHATGELTDDTLTIQVETPAIGGLDRPDHPVVSLIAVVTAGTIDEPVRVERTNPADGTITVRW